jgi:hypothetical protein
MQGKHIAKEILGGEGFDAFIEKKLDPAIGAYDAAFYDRSEPVLSDITVKKTRAGHGVVGAVHFLGRVWKNNKNSKKSPTFLTGPMSPDGEKFFHYLVDEGLLSKGKPTGSSIFTNRFVINENPEEFFERYAHLEDRHAASHICVSGIGAPVPSPQPA